MEHLYQKYWEKDNYRIIECQTCGFRHLYPFPNQEILEKYYQEKYHNEVKPFPYSKVTSDYLSNTKANIVNNRNYQEIYHKVMELKENPLQNMLDIGSGNDLLGVYFMNNDWKVNVIEPSQHAAGYLEKFDLNVFNSPVEMIDNMDLGSYSFINMQFVLEHIQDPRDILTKLYQRLNYGGVIRISVPNDFSEGQLAYLEHYQREFQWASLPDHINYFTFYSLKLLLESIGFREMYRTTNFPLEFLLMSGVDYYTEREERRKVHSIVTNFENSFKKTGREELLTQYYENLAKMGFGRSIFMYAKKE